MASMHKVKVGKQGRIVLPKELREKYQVNTGDEAIIIANGQELSIHLHKSHKDPLKHFIETSKKVSIGLSTEQLREFEEKQRIKDFKSKS
jgi:AbrB family looped-hinge helix DNA binding protein